MFESLVQLCLENFIFMQQMNTADIWTIRDVSYNWWYEIREMEKEGTRRKAARRKEHAIKSFEGSFPVKRKWHPFVRVKSFTLFPSRVRLIQALIKDSGMINASCLNGTIKISKRSIGMEVSRRSFQTTTEQRYW